MKSLLGLPVVLLLFLAPSSLLGTEVSGGPAVPLRYLGWLDYAAIAVYLLGMIWIGLLCSKQKTTEDYFLGNRKVSWWAAGISLYATGTSAISFMAIPAKTFYTDWKYYQPTIFTILGLIVIAQWIIPLVRRLNVVSIYEYLEKRFNRGMRLLGSAVFILLQLSGRISIVLFLPALAISTVTGLNVYASILLMGAVTILYTAKGGFTAVIWTDIAQVVVMFGGALLALGIIFAKVDMPASETWALLQANHKLDLLDTNFSLVAPTIWLFLLHEIAGLFTWVRDQSMLQRVLATPDVRSAVRSVWTLNLITIPGGLIFFGMGTALYLFYQSHPETLDKSLPHDAIFPYFIAQELPSGLVGIVIAGLFAGAMSTLSACINSVATAIVTDFGHWFPGSRSDATRLREAKVISVVVGILGTGIALIMGSLGMSSMWDTLIFLTGLIGGGVGGVFALGLFTRRANWQGAIIGTVASATLTLLVAYTVKANAFLYGVVAIFSCVIVGYVSSLLFKSPPQSLKGLTVFDA